MTQEYLLSYCMGKKGAYIDHPFGIDCTVVKVRGRIFAQLFTLHGVPCVTFNCERMTGELYRKLYPDDVKRGWHCPPVQQPYFNTVSLVGAVPEDELLRMADHSYSYVVSKLSKKLQKELAGDSAAEN